MFGYTAAEAVGRNIRMLIPDELQSEEDEILEQLRADRLIEHYETVRLTKDGRRLDVSLSISPVKNERGEIVGAAKIARDVSARKRADEALRAATAKFESVFNQSGIFAGILDLDGNLLEVNALAVDACGYTRDEVLGRPFWETPWWRGSEETQDLIRGAARRGATGEIFRETLRYWVADGTERIVDFAMHPVRDENGVVRFLHPTGIDITERERAEERFRSLVSIVTDVPWGADAEGRFTAPQPAWEGFTGQSEEQYLGDGWLDAVHTRRPRARARRLEGGDDARRALPVDRPPVARALGRVSPRRGARDAARPGRRPRRGMGRRLHGRARERTVAEEALRAREAEEREIAIGLQRALLPGRLATLPRLAFAARYEAGSDVLEVGGDWYDAFALPDGRVGLTVGDVVGHGLAAAAAMGQLRTALAALAQHAAGPGELLTRLEGFLLRSGTTDFATVCYAVLDPSTGVLDYASAGHPPMLLVTASGETHLLDGAQSAPPDGPRRARATSGERRPRAWIPARPLLGRARRAPWGALQPRPAAAPAGRRVDRRSPTRSVL